YLRDRRRPCECSGPLDDREGPPPFAALPASGFRRRQTVGMGRGSLSAGGQTRVGETGSPADVERAAGKPVGRRPGGRRDELPARAPARSPPPAGTRAPVREQPNHV